MNIEGGFLLLSFLLLTSAQEPQTCSAPAEYPHTRLDPKYSSRQKFSHGEKVYYSCAEDFTPYRGVPKIQCVHGQWTRLTLKCEKRACGNAGDLLNGILFYEGNSYIGDRVFAVCNKGYILKGLDYMICKKSGWTGDFPTCEEEVPTCSSPAVVNSVSSSKGVSMHQLGQSLNFTCKPGFQLNGAQRITCGLGGRWQPEPPRCQPPPEKTQLPDKEAGGCGVPEITRNSKANLADKYITKTSFSSGDRVQYVCDVGYIPAGGSRYRRCNQGKWSPLRLKCERRSCGSAGEILNGQFEYTGVEFGDTATAVCDVGHHLVGKAERHCMSRGWDGRIPDCEAVTCEAPPPVKNAYIVSPEEETYLYRRVIRYQCRVGVLTGKREIWCTESGEWSDPPPTCKEIMCPPPNVPNASWTRAYKEMYHPGDTLYISCDSGYVKSGPNSLTCGADGKWLPFPPECKRSSQNYRRGYSTG
ncbi:complement receptor type 1-like isoform X3 [Halichoeres trimaculatus]|uniref:complement receptor type 1-like isoform X3 n=1 Tax=Halichoeres trimaculatus TaxID=147232 RepID=UPI003D9EB77D